VKRRFLRARERAAEGAEARVDPELAARLTLLRWALIGSVALLLIRFDVSRHTGFGDAEALYACYALHPQPAYLDHPGLIGLVARFLGHGSAPTPEQAHTFTAIAATLFPWFGAFAARATGASWRGAFATALALVFAPELALGLYAFTPALLLAFFWIGAIGLSAVALRSEARSFRALIATLGAGLMVGAACLAHVSGVLLGVALVLTWLTRPARSRWRTFAPWGALALGAVLVTPLVLWEVRLGYPLLKHRFIGTQYSAGLSLRNLGALLGGQLLYITPPYFFAAALLARDAWRRRHDDAVHALLWWSIAAPAAALIALCLWSRVAEPHWLAPAYLGLALVLAHSDVVKRRLAIGSVLTGAFVALLAWAWVVTTLPMRLLGKYYPARYDLANDLYAWGPARRLLKNAVETTMIATSRLPVVVGPHWIVCAQAAAALGGHVPVGCNTPVRDDFDRWLPRSQWIDAPVILYVSDNRFHVDPSKELPHRKVESVESLQIRRGGVAVRRITVTRLDKASDVGERAPRGVGQGLASSSAAVSPAARIMSRSRSGPGFGVVSNRSP
jgi:Dolichyl-phosphate-mannose-protein mannosyltransferase